MKTVKIFNTTLLFALSFSWSAIVRADGGKESAGEFAQNAMTGALMLEKVMHNLCLIGGAFLILSSFFQYMRFRRNPSEMTIGRPITTLIVGLVLIAITFIPMRFLG